MIVALFRTENALSHALHRLRDARIGPLETYTPAPLRDELDAFRPARPEPGALVCPNRFGMYVDLDNWRRRVWDKATEASGVDATIYDIRHSYCSLLIHEGRSVPYVAAAMGTPAASRPSRITPTCSMSSASVLRSRWSTRSPRRGGVCAICTHRLNRGACDRPL